MSRVAIRWLHSAERQAAARVWTALESRLDSTAIACSWDWTEAWLDQYGPVVPHRFAVGDVDGDVCAIVLVTNGADRRRGPFRVRSLHLGTAGEPSDESVYVEYNQTLTEPRYRDAFAACLLEELARDPRWHELRLDGFESSAAEPFLTAEPLLVAQRCASPTAVLGGGDLAGETVLATLPSRTRRKVRRTLDALGDTVTEWAATPEHALDILSELIHLHQKRWARVGKPGAFAGRRFTEFHRKLVPRLIPKGAVLLFRVRAKSRTVGCLYHFIEGDRVLFYQSGFADYSAQRHMTPGFATYALCMQECRDRGFAEYDFLAGESRYKGELTTVTRELVWATARRPARRWQVMDRVATIRQATRREAA